MTKETSDDLDHDNDQGTGPEPPVSSTAEVSVQAHPVEPGNGEASNTKPDLSRDPQRQRSTSASTTDSQAHHQRPGSKHRAHFPTAFHRPHAARTHSQRNLARFQRIALATGIEGAGGSQAGTAAASRRDHARKSSAPLAALALATTNGTGSKGEVNANNAAVTGRARGSGTATPATPAHPQPRPPIRRNLSSPVFLQHNSRKGSGSGAQKATNLGLNAAATKPKSKLAFALTSDGSDTGGGQDDEWEDHSSPYSQSGTTTPDREHQTDHQPREDNTRRYDSRVETLPQPSSKTTDIEPLKHPPSPPPSLQPRLHTRNDEPQTSVPAPSENHLTFAPLPSRSDSDAKDPLKARNMDQRPKPSSIAGQSHNSVSTNAGVSHFLTNGNSSGSGSTVPHGADVGSPPPVSPGHENQSTVGSSQGSGHPADAQKPPLSNETTTNSATANSPTPYVTGRGSDTRYRVSTLASRTQQRLWLQRDAVSASVNTLTNARAGKPRDEREEELEGDSLNSSGLDFTFIKLRDMNPVAPEVFDQDNNTEKIKEYLSHRPDARDRLLYKKYRTAFSVVHRFRNPVMDSFKRLSLLPTHSNRQEGLDTDIRFWGPRFRGRDDSAFAKRPATSSSMYPSMRMSPSRPQLKHSHSQLRSSWKTSREDLYDFPRRAPSPFDRLAEAYHQDRQPAAITPPNSNSQPAFTPQPASYSASRNTSRSRQTIAFDESSVASHPKTQTRSAESTATVDDEFLLRIWNLKDGNALGSFSRSDNEIS